jgi:hypothetical protein
MGSGEGPHGAAENVRPETTSGCADVCGAHWGSMNEPSPRSLSSNALVLISRGRMAPVFGDPFEAAGIAAWPYHLSRFAREPPTPGRSTRTNLRTFPLGPERLTAVAFVVARRASRACRAARSSPSRAVVRGVFVRRFARRVAYLVAAALEGGSNALQERPPPIE